ncbi:ABC transporter substrate-binding protein [Natrarchaeobaculum sulfurireducens]|uniref:ABC-type dipeptide/oligopeptide/nickel transportsystem, periplasmic component n=1 Tax=Natrarchaeobaculum sulfurireducens TaxID=2044521 RepID=A0A346PE01_9EURY|nr:ABC transporter substrate-binding protein [Natrarchaeobaculum sulfurireducens]AXR77746.1 ABC-type dipeptide/oligopeptide/nickel transportsystem, periplasmic component [Natrarchaeobaculum sulfurireducens]
MQGADKPTTDRRTILKLTGAASVSAGLGSIAGCLGDPNGEDDIEIDTLTITQGEFPDVEDPNDHITGPYFNVYDHVYEPLFDVTPGEEPEPRIVETWEHGDDGTVELTIQEGILFHDGQELTASDIEFTLERQIDPDVPPVSDQVAGLGSIEGAEAIDETTVELSYSGAPQLAEFEFGNYLRAVSQEWYENEAPTTDDGVISGDDASAFNGTGPYQVTEYSPGQNRIVLEPFEDYWGDEPHVAELVFEGETSDSGRVSSLLSDETDFIDNVQPTEVGNVEDDADSRVEEVTSFRNIFLPMKNEVEPFDSEEFRQAMNYAVDNEEIISDILLGSGSPMSQPTPPEVNGYNPDLEPYDHDLERAEELVEEAGFTEDDPAEITLHVPEGRYLNDAEVGERAADQIDQLPNVDCDLETQPFDVISDANSAGPDHEEIPFFLIGWGVITGDADYGMYGFFHDDGGVQSFRDEELQAELEATQVEDDPETREAMLQEVNEMAREKSPWVFLHQQQSIYGLASDIEWSAREDESVFVWEMD